MASSLALLRLAGGSGLLSSLCRGSPVQSLSVVAPSLRTRSFGSNAQMSRVEDDDDDDLEVDGRSNRSVSGRGRDFPGFFVDVFDPFTPSRSVSQLMNMVEQLMDSPFATVSRGMGPGGIRRGWDAKEDDSALYLSMDMPGLGKEDVKVNVEENTLIIKGEDKETSEEAESRRRYSTRIDLTPKLHKVDAIKAEMKNGVLKVVIPKVKEEERKDVFQVNVE